MGRDGERIIVGPDGTIRVSRAAERRLRDRSGDYGITVSAPGLLILRSDRTSAGARVIMAGEILTRMTMLEVLNVIANCNWRGELHVEGLASHHRVLTIDQGALKYARSDHADDRLGEVLYRHGVVDRPTLEDLLRQVTPDRRFGQLVVEGGHLGQEDLFQYLQRQAEQIFFGAMLESEGTYAFCTPGESDPPPAHTVHLPMQAMMMEGVQRIDEMALFREAIPSSSLIPEVQAGGRMSLDSTAMTVLAYCDGERTIADIARGTGLGEFHTTKTLYQLLQQGLIVLHTKERVDEEAIRRLVGAFNGVLQDIFVAVATYGGVLQTRMTLGAWMQGSGYAPYLGDEVAEDGTIDVDHVLAAAAAMDNERPIEPLHQALHELAAFALFAATTTLPRDQELSLARDVNRRLKTIRV